MKLLFSSATAVLAVALVGCGSSAKNAAITTGRLDCPTDQGQLTRVSAAPDGKSCLYKINPGTEVQLRLVPLLGTTAEVVLAKIEGELKAETQTATKPPAPGDAPSNQSAADAARALSQAQDDTAGDETSGDKSDAAEDWDANSIEAKVNAKLREKGIDSSEHPGGDQTQVDLPGIHINAGDDGATVRVGPIHVDANGDTATVRSFEAVRMRGEAFSTKQRGLRAMLVYAGDALGNGYKYVGYAAAGLQTGPIVVATVKSRSDGGFHGDIYGDIKRLVRRNGGT